MVNAPGRQIVGECACGRHSDVSREGPIRGRHERNEAEVMASVAENVIAAVGAVVKFFLSRQLGMLYYHSEIDQRAEQEQHMPTYLNYLGPRLDTDGRLNDFIELRDERVLSAGALDRVEWAERYGPPLEVSFSPLITRRIREMHAYFAAARARAGYEGDLVYAYATKANFAEEVVRTAVASGA